MKKTLPLAATGVILAFSLTACGSSSGNGSSGQSGQAGQSGQGGNGYGRPQGGGQGGGFPGASGKVAAVSGKTAQVQSTDSQTAVTWTSSTRFTREKKVTAAAVKVGACVMAMPARTATSSSPSSPSDSSTVAAATVRILSASGDCTSGLGGRFRSGSGGGFGGGTPPSGMPSGAPTNLPSAGGGAVRFGGFGAIGKVTAVSGSGFTVSADRNGSTTKVAVTTSSSTTYTENAKASASDVKVGTCMTAQGSTDSTGAVTARTVALSDAVNGSCTLGLGGFRGGFPGGAQQGTQGVTRSS